MKKIVLVLIVLIIGSLQNTQANKYRTNIDFETFYYSLQPYGEWIEIDYDVFVWRPYSVDNNWRPYSYGRWSWTAYGWYWESSEPFGWATFHYGRWLFHEYYGWIWYPDYTWAPAWVDWRYDDYYIGWTPLPPHAHFQVGVGIHFSINWNPGYSYWNFVPYRHFCHRNVNVYYTSSRDTQRFFSSTKRRTNYNIHNNRVVNYGIDRSDVERRGNLRVNKRNVSFDNSYSHSRINGSDVEKRAVIKRGESVNKASIRSRNETKREVRNNRPHENKTNGDINRVRSEKGKQREVNKNQSSNRINDNKVSVNNQRSRNKVNSGSRNNSAVKRDKKSVNTYKKTNIRSKEKSNSTSKNRYSEKKNNSNNRASTKSYTNKSSSKNKDSGKSRSVTKSKRENSSKSRKR